MSGAVNNASRTNKLAQDEDIYPEGKEVYAKDKGGEVRKFYVEEVKDGRYKLRENETKGVNVLDMEFPEADLSEDPRTLGLSMGTQPVDHNHTGSRTAENDKSIG